MCLFIQQYTTFKSLPGAKQRWCVALWVTVSKGKPYVAHLDGDAVEFIEAAPSSDLVREEYDGEGRMDDDLAVNILIASAESQGANHLFDSLSCPYFP